MNGIIVVNKEKDYTSFDVVAKLRGILKQKKIGHTGTLDPQATGVLPVCLGSATKLCDMLTDKKKEYIAEFILGKTTDTQDIWGTVTDEKEVTCCEADIYRCVKAFTGELLQVPPMYSAVWVDGKRLYDLARMGIEVERKARPVTVHELEVLSVDLPKVQIRLVCSKGTYVRTLIHDMGQTLCCGAVMTSLKRTQSGEFGIDRAYTIDEIATIRDAGKLQDIVIPVDEAFTSYPAIILPPTLKKVILNGNLIYKSELEKLPLYEGKVTTELFKKHAILKNNEKKASDLCKEGQKCRVYLRDDLECSFMAIYQFHKERKGMAAYKMFLPEEYLPS